ncbi:holo-ACP synthase [Schaalia sp. 19OD2882]|nr:holo-ACP synthase [Schaalia sp. 19OD2882]
MGTGIDLVDVPAFAEQLAVPGSTFARVFTDREWSHAHRHESAAASLAVRWAAKEAAVKAWSTLVFGQAPAVPEAELDWAHVEVVHDAWNRPDLRFHGRVKEELDRVARRLGARLEWSLSLSHDGDRAIAMATCLALVPPDGRPG